MKNLLVVSMMVLGLSAVSFAEEGAKAEHKKHKKEKMTKTMTKDAAEPKAEEPATK